MDLAHAHHVEELGVAGRRDVKKITINNALRGELKQLIAGFKLKSDKTSERIEAARSIINDPSVDLMPLVSKAIEEETNTDVRAVLDLAEAAIIVTDKSSTVAQKKAAALAKSK